MSRQEAATTTSSATLHRGVDKRSLTAAATIGRDVVDEVIVKLPEWLRHVMDSSDVHYQPSVTQNNSSSHKNTTTAWTDQVRTDFRLLQARAPNSFGKFDRPQARVAAILACRCSATSTTNASASQGSRGPRRKGPQAQSNNPRQALAIVGGVTINTLDQLCILVNNVLRPSLQRSSSTKEDSSNQRQPSTFRKDDPAAAKHQITRPLTSSTPSTIIPELALQLGNRIPDAEGVARRAQQLMERVEHFISTSVSSHLRSGYAYDLQQHRSAYEAACFYWNAKYQEGTTTGATATTTTKGKKSKKNIRQSGRKRVEVGDDNNYELDRDDDDNNDDQMGMVGPLELNHVLQSLSSCSSTAYVDLKILKGVVAFLTKLLVKMDEDDGDGDDDNDDKAIRRKESTISAVPEKEGAAALQASKRKRNHNLHTSETSKRIKKGIQHHADSRQEVANMRLNRVNHSRPDERVLDDVAATTTMTATVEPGHAAETMLDHNHPNADFLEWKEKVLMEASCKAKESLGKEDATDLELIVHAANDVLRRYGITPLLK